MRLYRLCEMVGRGDEDLARRLAELAEANGAALGTDATNADLAEALRSAKRLSARVFELLIGRVESRESEPPTAAPPDATLYAALAELRDDVTTPGDLSEAEVVVGLILQGYSLETACGFADRQEFRTVPPTEAGVPGHPSTR